MTTPPLAATAATAGATEAERTSEASMRWVAVAAVDQLTPGRGLAALVDGRQVAIFRLEDDIVLAVGNYDPFGRAHVLSRGIVGDRGGIPKVASPIYKQSFDLRTGQCLDDESVRIPTYPVRVAAGQVEVGVVSVAADVAVPGLRDGSESRGKHHRNRIVPTSEGA